MNLKAMAIFDHAHPKIIESTFSFPEFVPACKNHFAPSIYFWDTVNFEFRDQTGQDPFLTMPTQKHFD